MSYAARQAADLHAAAPELRRLWEENLDFDFDPAEKHRWYYLDNPQGRGAAFFLHPSADDGTPAAAVGCAGVGARRFRLRGADARAAVVVDMAVSRQHRTLFPALTLQRALQEHARAQFDFSFAKPNASAAKIVQRLGYEQLGTMRRYVRVLHYEPYVARLTGHRLLAQLGGLALDTATRAWDRLRHLAARPTRFNLLWNPTIDQRFDRLWERTRDAYTVVAYRGADYVRWRYLEAPTPCRCAIVTLCDPKTAELHAYAAIDEHLPVAAIHDLFGSPTALDALLGALLPELAARGFGSASFDFLGTPLLVETLHAHAFAQREEGLAIFVNPSGHPAAASLLNAGSWFVTEGDLDG